MQNNLNYEDLCAKADDRKNNKDYGQALELYKKSAEGEFHWAQVNLGHFYRDGRAVEKNLEIAVDWYQKAANQGNDHAIQAIKELSVEICQIADKYRDKSDYARALELYKRSAEGGYHWAQSNLGYFYRDGLGVDKNLEEAVKWYRKADSQNNPDAKVNVNKYEKLRQICEEADGYRDAGDYVKALELYKQSADYHWSQANLGDFYREGHGVDKNFEEAIKWYKKAADQGNTHVNYYIEEYKKYENSRLDVVNELPYDRNENGYIYTLEERGVIEIHDKTSILLHLNPIHIDISLKEYTEDKIKCRIEKFRELIHYKKSKPTNGVIQVDWVEKNKNAVWQFESKYLAFFIERNDNKRISLEKNKQIQEMNKLFFAQWKQFIEISPSIIENNTLSDVNECELKKIIQPFQAIEKNYFLSNDNYEIFMKGQKILLAKEKERIYRNINTEKKFNLFNTYTNTLNILFPINSDDATDLEAISLAKAEEYPTLKDIELPLVEKEQLIKNFNVKRKKAKEVIDVFKESLPDFTDDRDLSNVEIENASRNNILTSNNVFFSFTNNNPSSLNSESNSYSSNFSVIEDKDLNINKLRNSS